MRFFCCDSVLHRVVIVEVGRQGVAIVEDSAVDKAVQDREVGEVVVWQYKLGHCVL